MANDGKYLSVTTGRVQQESAINTSAGAGDAGKLAKLDSTGKWDASMMPAGVVADTKIITASEALTAGDFVNVWNSTGVKVRKADGTATGKECNGFVLANVANGASATVYFEGPNTQRSGMTVGARQYLSTTPGAATETPLAGSGNVVQYLGVAVSATEMNFEPEDGIILA